MKGPFFSRAAFSLVEVVIALGVVTFCIVTLVALLPAGLSSVSNARHYAAAASGVEKITDAIREAVGSPANQYVAAGSFTNLVWTVGGPSTSYTMTNISLSGDPVTASEPELTAHVQITPPSNLVSSGTALVSVAWPNRATWVASANKWENAEGSIFTCFIFLPKQ